MTVDFSKSDHLTIENNERYRKKKYFFNQKAYKNNGNRRITFGIFVTYEPSVVLIEQEYRQSQWD